MTYQQPALLSRPADECTCRIWEWNANLLTLRCTDYDTATSRPTNRVRHIDSGWFDNGPTPAPNTRPSTTAIPTAESLDVSTLTPITTPNDGSPSV